MAIIGALIGLVSGVLPGIVDIFHKKVEFEYEVKMLELRTEAFARNIEYQMALEDIRADAREGESLRSHDRSLRGGKFIESLRASVRPVITYLFFGLFCFVEGFALYQLYTHSGGAVDTTILIREIWDANTQNLFAAVLSFWFGSRAMQKFTDRYTYRLGTRMHRTDGPDLEGIY